MSTCVIYGLYDPRTGDLRYVGKTTTTLEHRFRKHLWRARAGSEFHVSRWIRTLLVDGLKPRMLILEEPLNTEADLAERHWIAKCRQRGDRLTNLTDGGDGASGEAAAKGGRVGGLRGGPKAAALVHAEKLPDGRSKHAVKLAQIMNSQRWSCDECGVTSNSGALGRHQKATKHLGRTRVG